MECWLAARVHSRQAKWSSGLVLKTEIASNKGSTSSADLLHLLLQEMLEDELDAVAALALECLALLCEADALDFYKAWPVVCKQFPTIPKDRPAVAEQWVALLGHGHLDARAYPERAAAIIDLLWLAAADPLPMVSYHQPTEQCCP